MKKLYVPLTSDELCIIGKEKYLRELHRIMPDMVFLSVNSYHMDEGEKEKTLQKLRQNVSLLNSEGFRTAAWIWSFMISDKNDFVHITGADGKTDGILKYMFDYTASPDYEMGYIEKHLKNRKLREDIERIFSGKEDAGIGIFEHMEKLRNASLTSGENHADPQALIFSRASRFMCQFSVPVYYTEKSKLITVFGENIKHLKNINDHDLILDAYAARYLQNQGTDIGAIEIGEDLLCNKGGLKLYYPPDEEISSQPKWNIHPKKAVLCEGCSVLLWYIADDIKYPAAYTYRSENGNKFLVFLFDSRFSDRNASCNYLYQRALIKGFDQICPNKLPAVCTGNPDLHMITKKKENKLAVALFNCFADDVMYPSVRLSGDIGSIRFINCTGTFERDTVNITEIKPYQISAFEAELQ